MKEMTALSLESWELPRTDNSSEILRTEKETNGAAPWVGVKALMLAVLDDAIQCLRSSQSLVRIQAEQWIKSRERRYVFSFAVICETLSLDPSAVRRSVMELVGTRRELGDPRRRSRPNVRRGGPLQLARSRRRKHVYEGSGLSLG